MKAFTGISNNNVNAVNYANVDKIDIYRGFISPIIFL